MELKSERKQGKLTGVTKPVKYFTWEMIGAILLLLFSIAILIMNLK